MLWDIGVKKWRYPAERVVRPAVPPQASQAHYPNCLQENPQEFLARICLRILNANCSDYPNALRCVVTSNLRIMFAVKVERRLLSCSPIWKAVHDQSQMISSR